MSESDLIQVPSRPATPGPYEPRTRSDEDWGILGRYRLNSLLIGSDSFVDDALLMMSSSFAAPVVVWTAGQPLPPPPGAATLILREISELTQFDQQRLEDWLERATTRTPVVSTASTPIWPLVERGVFLEKLYYRLNTLTITLP
jgi:hypothetical protein